MFKRIILKNWKSFRHAVLPLDPLTVVIGINSSGKSNAVEALDFLRLITLSTVFILPLAAVIETGNHITQIKSENYESSPYNMAMELTKIMVQAADEASPWVAFGEQSSLWEGEGLKKLASEWQSVVSQRISLGDTTIKILAEYYCDENQCLILPAAK